MEASISFPWRQPSGLVKLEELNFASELPTAGELGYQKGTAS